MLHKINKLRRLEFPLCWTLSLTPGKGSRNSVILPSTLLAWELEHLLSVLTSFMGTQGFQVRVNLSSLQSTGRKTSSSLLRGIYKAK